MAVKKEQLDDARRQGQFEGQVLTTLGDIKVKIEGINSNYGSLEGRLRVVETGQTSLHDAVKKSIDENHLRNIDADKVHDTLQTTQEEHGKKIRKLEDWRLYIMGIAAAIGVIASAIYQYFIHH